MTHPKDHQKQEDFNERLPLIDAISAIVCAFALVYLGGHFLAFLIRGL